MGAKATSPDPAPDFVGLDRLTTADAAATIERLQGSPLLAAGEVNLVGLSAIQARLGERWEHKRRQVWEQAERCFARQMGPAALAVRVSETDYLVTLAGAGRFGAQTSCLSVLREILTFFLGEANPADLRLREVTALSAQGADCSPVDPLNMRANPVAGAGPAAPPPPDPAPAVPTAPPSSLGLTVQALARPSALEEAGEEASPDRWSPFVAGDGRELKVSCRMEPVFELQQFRLVGHRLEPSVQDVRRGTLLDSAAVSALSPGDRERVDLATIARGVSRLRSAGDRARQPLLMLPAAFTTLGATRGRTALSLALKEARLDEMTRIVCEICDLNGAPSSRLVETASLIKPFCWALLGRVVEDRRVIEAVTKAAFNGLSLDCSSYADEGQDLLLRLHAWAIRVKTHAKVCMALGLPGPQSLALAKLAGITHASMRPEAVRAVAVTSVEI